MKLLMVGVPMMCIREIKATYRILTVLEGQMILKRSICVFPFGIISGILLQ
jgi:hypothetical protein